MITIPTATFARPSFALADAMAKVDIAALPPTAVDMEASPTISPWDPPPNVAAFRAARLTTAAGSLRPVVARSSSSPAKSLHQTTQWPGCLQLATEALAPPRPTFHAPERAGLAEQIMVAQLDEAFLIGAYARAYPPMETDGAGDSRAESRRELTAALRQAARCAGQAHTARVQAQPDIFDNEDWALFTMGHLCQAAIDELLLYGDDDDPNAQNTLIEGSTTALLQQLCCLMNLPQQQRLRMYSQSDEQTRQRVVRVVIGAVMRNCPEPFIDEPMADTTLGDWQRMRRWRHRYPCDLVAGGTVAAPMYMPVAPDNVRERRPFLGQPWDKALAWLDDVTLSLMPAS